MQTQSCCPNGSWPRLQANYKAKGQKIEIANTHCYHIGEGNKVLFMVSDIFGATSGEHQSFADTFANFGFNVYLPELLTEPYNGQADMVPILASIKNQNFEVMQQRFNGVSKYLEQQGHKRFYVVGFCWGVWFAFKMATEHQNIICIAGMHPSLGLQKFFGGEENKLTEQSKCPAFFYPAGNDPANVKPEGQLVQILTGKFGAQKTGSHQFPDMSHGWTTRGDIKDEKVKRDVSEAIHQCRAYFAKFQ